MPKSRPTSSRPEWIELHPVKHEGTEQANTQGITSRGMTVKIHQTDSSAMKQGLHFPDPSLQKPLHQRKISLFQKVVSLLNKFAQLLKGPEQPSKDAVEQLQMAGSPFLLETAPQEPSHPSVSKYLENTKYSQRFQHLMTQLKNLDKKYTLSGEDSTTILNKLLSPEITRQGTNMDTLKAALKQHGITLQARATEADPSELEEIKLTLTEGELAAMKETKFFHAYQMYLIISGLITIVGVRKSKIMDRDIDMVSKEAQELAQLSSTLVEMMNLTMGLCHAAMKAEMPELYRDDLYTALSLQDEKGYSHFRADGVQPRGNWSDRI